MSEKLVAEFIQKALNRYGTLYDYSKVSYINSHKKVCIGCPIHGYFYITPTKHLSSQGCSFCGIKKRSKSKKLTLNDFMERSNLVHGVGKYDYTKVLYELSLKKVCIVCPIHGDFFQTPGNHMSGQGCPICSRYLTTNEFIEKAKQVHGEDKYDYSSVEYRSTYEKVCIVCPVHGKFYQKPNLHLMNHGCPLCAILKNSNRQKHTTCDFIKRAVSQHGYGKYDYSKVYYRDAKTKVCIICSTHGEFYQIPDKHLSGHNCPLCSRTSKGELAIIKWFIKRKIEYKHQYFFPDLRSPFGKPLEFDFCIKYIKVLIEYDGEQHFKPVRFNGISEEQACKLFEKIKYHDSLKDQYCIKNNIPLIRIPYKDFKNIQEILDTKLLRCGVDFPVYSAIRV